MASTFREIEIDPTSDDGYIEVEFTGDVRIENDGIGPYEYWGSKEYDKGIDYPVCEEVEWDKSIYTPEVNAKIAAHLEEHFKSIAEDIEQDYINRDSNDD